MSVIALKPEWQRVELLVDFVKDSRSGAGKSNEKVAALNLLQQTISDLRDKDIWKSFVDFELDNLELDILASVIAPVLSPKTAWMFKALQSLNTPYPTPHFLMELLAIPVDMVSEFFAKFKHSARLLKSKMISLDGQFPFGQIKPSQKIIQSILGYQSRLFTPPSSTFIPSDGLKWDDLILSQTTKGRLEEFLVYVSQKETLKRHWGAQRFFGPVALFSGPPGTGKTLSAAVIASEIGWPLFRVDLGRIVSKYIGDTEKNFNALFDAVHGQKIILQFDEADALFSKRAAVRDARDRYANMEVSHLLTRIEHHDGPCILTTNLRDNIDPAFARRFSVIVDFPRPDVSERIALWVKHLPSSDHLSPDLDLECIAKNAVLTGGNIKSAALHASVLALQSNLKICNEVLVKAIWRELGKDGRPVKLHELGELATYMTEVTT